LIIKLQIRRHFKKLETCGFLQVAVKTGPHSFFIDNGRLMGNFSTVFNKKPTGSLAAIMLD